MSKRRHYGGSDTLEQERAYIEGAVAHEEGKKIDANPHDSKHTRLRKAWFDGFLDSRTKARLSKGKV